MAPYRRQYAEGTEYYATERPPWSPAQLVVVAAGILLAVIGGIALARGGVHFNAIPLTHSTVAGLHFTCLSALVTLIVGVLLVSGGGFPYSAKSTMWTLGVVLLAWGLIVAIDPRPFFNMWGYTSSTGVFYAVVGGILILAGAISPVFFSRRVAARDAAIYQPGYEEPVSASGGPRRVV